MGKRPPGEPRASDEATPFWAPLEAVPFERMWAADRIWFPWLLGGELSGGRFTFDGDTVLDFSLRPLNPPATDEDTTRSPGATLSRGILILRRQSRLLLRRCKGAAGRERWPEGM